MTEGTQHPIRPDMAVDELRALLAQAPAGSLSENELHIAREIFYSAGAYAEAEVLAQQMVDRFGASEGALLALATIHMRLGARDRAGLVVTRLVDNADPSERTLQFAVNFFLEGADWDQAGAMAQRLASRYAGLNATLTLARIAAQSRQFEEMSRLLEEAVRIDPRSADAWRMLSTAYAECGRLGDALRSGQSALELNPSVADYWYQIAIVTHRLGNSEQALEWLEKARTLNPRNTNFILSKANILNEVGRTAEAIRMLDAAGHAETANRDIQKVRLLFLARQQSRTSRTINSHDDKVSLNLPRAKKKNNHALTTWQLARIQMRVILSLMVRDVVHRTAHSSLGILWALVEPVTQVIMLGVVLSIFNHGVPPLGTSLFFFYSTGVMPFYLFLHVVNSTTHIYSEKNVLLSVPRIRRADLAISQVLTEFIIGLLTTLLVFSGFFAFGYGQGGDNIGQAVAAYAAVGLFAFGVGLIGAVMANITGLWEQSWQTVQRSLYFLSGIFFIPNMMPEWARSILVWNPLLVGIEWFRSGFFHDYNPSWIDVPYLVFISMALVTFGLALERASRRMMRVIT